MEREFTRELMRDIANNSTDEFDKVEDDIIDTGRWTVQHMMVFKEMATGKHYSSYFNRGATEYQDESPYEYDSKIIKCHEVIQKEVTVKQWVRKEK